jgi:carbon monoxide dehydrogenase subunit G
MIGGSSSTTQNGGTMAGRFEGTTHIDRPIEEVFAFLADGENDPKFSPRVVEIAKTSDGPPGVGTTYASTVKDAGMKTKREFKLTQFDSPTRIRWTELSKNLVTASEGGYDLTRDGVGTRLTVHNELEGHGVGKLLAPLALRAARKDADAFAQRIKRAVEAS